MKPLSQDPHFPLPAAADHRSYSTHWSAVKEKEKNIIIIVQVLCTGSPERSCKHLSPLETETKAQPKEMAQ